MNSGQINLLVFRDEHKRVSGNDLKSALAGEVACCVHSGRVLRPFLRAGELESGVADRAPDLLPNWERVTDQIVETLLSGENSWLVACLTLARQSAVPSYVHISKPEGFAYYGLHPLAYADVLDKLGPLPSTVGVIGIRSIGTTLSAVTAAAARRRGLNASRTTVRPEGHPYNRHTEFTAPQLAWVKERSSLDARFLVVDEGPGLSGSSFLSVAEALVTAGVPVEEIVLICGHAPDLAALCTDDAPQRASRFRWVAVDSKPPVPEGAEVFMGGGEWRRLSFAHEPDWPPSWTSFERLKYLSQEDPKQRRLFKFAGFGHYGDAVIEREREIAEAGFGPVPACTSHGFAVYPWLRGRPMRTGNLSEGVLLRLAEYCAFRAWAFPAACPDPAPLQEMAEHDLDQLGFDFPVTLRLERPVIPDGRMQPHEWLLTDDGQMLKTDSGSHGDDHFFPGPTDIAWDLAGAIVEWRMNAADAEYFLESYRHAAGDDPSPRIHDFITAYLVFRCAYCRMAANALLGTGEEARLRRAANGYLALIFARMDESQAHRALFESPA
jgi:hypothetical protein